MMIKYIVAISIIIHCDANQQAGSLVAIIPTLSTEESASIAKSKCNELSTGDKTVISWQADENIVPLRLVFTHNKLLQDSNFPLIQNDNGRYEVFIQPNQPLDLSVGIDMIWLNSTIVQLTRDVYSELKPVAKNEDFKGQDDGATDSRIIRLNSTYYQSLPVGESFFSMISEDSTSNSSTSLWFGSLVKVTVVPSQCMDEEHQICGNSGICAFIRGLQSTFTCHCCAHNRAGDTCSVVNEPNHLQHSIEEHRRLAPPLAPPDPFCSTNYYNCSDQPCEHGICVQYPNYFQCYCQPGYDGECCQFDVDECLSGPCRHSGICYNLANGFQCDCPRGWIGRRCELPEPERECDFTSCAADQICIVDNNKVICLSNASNSLTSCSHQPCFNQGVCYMIDDRPSCICKPGYFGQYCQQRLRPFHTGDFSVEGGTKVWVTVGFLLSAFFLIALVLLVCHCHMYTCQLRIPYKRYHDDEETRISRTDPKYTNDDISISFHEPAQISMEPILHHQTSDTQCLMVTKTV